MQICVFSTATMTLLAALLAAHVLACIDAPNSIEPRLVQRADGGSAVDGGLSLFPNMEGSRVGSETQSTNRSRPMLDVLAYQSPSLVVEPGGLPRVEP